MADSFSNSQGSSQSHSQGDSQSQNSSDPFNMNSAQSDWGLQLSQLLSILGDHQYNWAMGEYNRGRDITDQNINNSLALSGMGTDMAKELINQYRDKFEPVMNDYIQQAGTYNSEARQRFAMGQAESTVAQADQAALHEAERQLQSYGINPNSGVYQNLELSRRTQDAAARAGAGTQAALDTADRGRAMTADIAHMGQNVPGMAVNSLQAGLAGVTAAQNANLGQQQAGVNLSTSAAPYFNASTASNKLPPVGNVSRGESQSKNVSDSTSKQGSVSSSKSPSKEGGEQGGDPNKGQQQPQQQGRGGQGNQGNSTSGGGPKTTYAPDDGTGERVNPQTGEPITNDYPEMFVPSGPNTEYDPYGQQYTPENAPWSDPAAGQQLPQNFDPGTSYNNPWQNLGPSAFDPNSWNPNASFPEYNTEIGNVEIGDAGQIPDNAKYTQGQNDTQDFGSDQDFSRYGAEDDTQQGSYDSYDSQDYNQQDYSDQFNQDDWQNSFQQPDDWQQQDDFQQSDDWQNDYQQPDEWQQQDDYQQDDYQAQDDSYQPQDDYYQQDDYSDYDSGDYGGDYARGGPVQSMRPRQRGVLPTTGGPVSRNASPSRGRQTDDIPARLNAGEFVIPRDVTAHFGTKHFQDLIKKSRQARMGVSGPPAKPKMKPSLRLRPTFVSRGM